MPTLQGHYKVPHFDAKEAANTVFTDAGVPTTFLYTVFSRALGEQVAYHDLDPGFYRALGFLAAVELGNMFQFKRDFVSAYVGARDLDQTRQLHPTLMTFDAWLAMNRDRIPLPT